MRCPACDADNPGRSKFCNECGTSLTRVCSSCGEVNLPRAKFCGQCGRRLPDAGQTGQTDQTDPAEQPAPAPQPAQLNIAVPDAERRQLTVMFCDLVGSTKLSGQIDPEDLREVTRAYQEAASRVIQQFDGYVAQLLGDGILVYFGYPNAHEDDAQRAGRAGLEIITAVHALNQRLRVEVGVEIAVRIGIHTGTTVIGAMGYAQHQEQLAIGETPNVAARVQGLAEPNTVVISAVTGRLTQGAFEWRDLGYHRLAGVAEPMQVYRLVRAIETRSRLMSLTDAALTPLIGRDAELSELLEYWSECAAGSGRVVLVEGEAGIGKSRLVRAFAASLASQPHTWLHCRCSPFYTSTALRPLIEMLGELFNLQSSDQPAARLDNLEVQLSGHGLAPADYVPLLARLLSIPTEDRYDAPALSPQMAKQKTLELVIELLLAVARGGSLVFVMEDLHWVDQSTLEFLDLFARGIADFPALALFTARTEFHPPWSTHAHISLGRLQDDQVAKMITGVAGGKPLPDGVSRSLAAKADGNPLYVEELTHMVLESGQLVETEDSYELDVALPSLAIPATLRDSLMARLDHLSSSKTVIQVAATIGRLFDYALIKEVLQSEGDGLRGQLEQLVEAGLLFKRGTEDRVQYAFRHALVQDAAYGSLLRRTRKKFHWRIADALEEIAPETPPEVLAHHYTEAGQDAKAILYWHAAGQSALESWALAEATEHLQRGLSVVEAQPESQGRTLEELSLRVAMGMPLMLTRGYAAPDVEATYLRAFELCSEVGDAAAHRLFPALWGLWSYYQVKALYPKAEEMGERLLDLAERSGDSGIALGAHQAMGASCFWRGRVATARNHFEHALAIYDAKQHGHLAFLFAQDARAFCLGFMVWIHWHDGDLEGARQYRAKALDYSAALGQPSSTSFVAFIVAAYHCLVGEYDQAEAHAEKLIALSRQQGYPHWEAYGHITLGWSLSGRGDVARGIETISAGIGAMLGVGSRTAMTLCRGAQAEVELKSGRLAKAREILDELMVFIGYSDERCYEAELVRLQGELALAGENSPQTKNDQARDLFRRALDIATRQGAEVLADKARASLAVIE